MKPYESKYSYEDIIKQTKVISTIITLDEKAAIKHSSTIRSIKNLRNLSSFNNRNWYTIMPEDFVELHKYYKKVLPGITKNDIFEAIYQLKHRSLIKQIEKHRMSGEPYSYHTTAHGFEIKLGGTPSQINMRNLCRNKDRLTPLKHADYVNFFKKMVGKKNDNRLSTYQGFKFVYKNTNFDDEESDRSPYVFRRNYFSKTKTYYVKIEKGRILCGQSY